MTRPDVEACAAKVGDAILDGKVLPGVGHEAIGAFAAWQVAAEAAITMAMGGGVPDPAPSAMYALAGDDEELARYGRVLRDAGVAVPWDCPDCGVTPGEDHEDYCDVARCPGCGRQALQCDEHLSAGRQAWTGRWPGEKEVEAGLATDLNDLAMKGLAKHELVWDTETQQWRKP